MRFPRFFSVFFLALFLGVFVAPVVTFTGCSSAPSQRTTEVVTLKVIGATADAGMTTAAQMLKAGQISVVQFQKVAEFYDMKFQPAYRLAVQSVQYNLDSVSSPDLVLLASQLGELVLQLQNHNL